MVPTREKVSSALHCVFRVDASTDIGTGHVMRCLTLATALTNNHHKVSFICRQHEGNLIEYIRSEGFEVTALATSTQPVKPGDINPHAHWLGASWQQDADDTISALKNTQKTDWLIVDHYALDDRWEDKIRPGVTAIFSIDDLADRNHNVELLLDQNYYPGMQHRYDDLLPANTVKLIGPKYTLLRDEFIRCRDNTKTRSGEIRNLLVFFGGVDADNLTLKTLRALQTMDTSFKINVIIGNTNLHKDDILKSCKSMQYVTCQSNINNMAELMLKADLAIGAGGTTTWERCFLGLPAITVTLAQNQALVNETVAQKGAIILIGDNTINENDITDQLQKLMDNPAQLHRMSVAALTLMRDHIGAQGVVEAMEQLHA